METNQETQLKNKYPLPVLLYDSECVLCNRFKQSLERAPGTNNITMVPISHEEIYRAYPKLNPEEAQKTLHLLDEKENILLGHDAVSYLIVKWPIVKKFSWLIESDMGKKAVKFFHSQAEQIRDSLQKRCKGCYK